MFDLDTSQLPLAILKDPGVEADDREFDAFLERFDAIMLRWEPNPLALILDVRNSRVPPPPQRHRVQSRLGANTPAQRMLTSVAVVMTSELFHYLVATMLWRRQVSYDVRECTTMEEARAWSLEQLEAKGHDPDLRNWERLHGSVVPEF